MAENPEKFEGYFAHLSSISLAGRIYKRFVSSPVLYFCARRFGTRIVEIGSGTASGVLGAYPKRVRGLEINSIAVEYCRSAGLDVELIGDDGRLPAADRSCDVCVLDNVLEHIEDAKKMLDECYRITDTNGGLVIAVPGRRGYDFDSDHKKFYDADALKRLDERWSMQSIFSIPFWFRSERLSRSVKQYCLVATYKKRLIGQLHG
ncbi:MAG TPA: methyltransferase domain-containing protein [Gallionella sp.]|nr:methyltransferase domain-containing protein [Gallionella sp.]